MQVLDIRYLRDVNSHKNTLLMHELKINFDKILPIVKETFADYLNSDLNFQSENSGMQSTYNSFEELKK